MSRPDSAIESVTSTRSSANSDLLDHIEHRVQIVERGVAHVPDAEGRLFTVAVAAAEGEAAFFHLGANRIRRFPRPQGADGARRMRRIGRSLRVLGGALQCGVAHAAM